MAKTLLSVDELKAVPASECGCFECVDLCRRPCWPLPEEAEKIMDAGFSEKLMLDYWVSFPDDIYILCGANPGYEGGAAPEVSFMDKSVLQSGCTFLKENKCTLHDSGLKPIEGRIAIHGHTNNVSLIHESIARAWDNDKARALIAKWKQIVNF